MRLLVLALGALVVGGCIQAPADPLAVTQSAPPAAEPFRVELHDCIEGGGHTVYNADYGPVAAALFPEVHFAPPEWQPADIREDVGNPILGQMHDPVLGPAAGYYHATVTCKGWTYLGESHTDWVSGHVGIRVEPPPFDPGGADRHYLISTLPFAEPGLAAALRALGVPATNGTGLIEQGQGWHSELDDELNGTYKSWNTMKDLGAVPDFVVRLWFTVLRDDGASWRPVAIDMTTTGRPHHLASDGGGRFTHQHVGEAPPQEGPVESALSNTAGLGWQGFDRVLTLGPQPDVRLDHGFKHH